MKKENTIAEFLTRTLYTAIICTCFRIFLSTYLSLLSVKALNELNFLPGNNIFTFISGIREQNFQYINFLLSRFFPNRNLIQVCFAINGPLIRTRYYHAYTNVITHSLYSGLYDHISSYMYDIPCSHITFVQLFIRLLMKVASGNAVYF